MFFELYEHSGGNEKVELKISIKIRMFYFLHDMINITNIDLNIEMDKNYTKNILVYFNGYVTPKSVKPFYIIINKVNGYIWE